MRLPRRGMIALGAMVLLVGGAGVAYAAGIYPSSPSGRILACAQRQNGQLRVVNAATQCLPSEYLVTLAAPPRPTNELVDCRHGAQLQQAIDSADSTQPVTISIVGTCTEAVFVGRDDVTLRSGAPGAGISGADGNPALSVTGRNVAVDNLLLEGGDSGMALVVDQGGGVQATGDHVEGIVAAAGNAVAALGTVTLDHCGKVSAHTGASVTVDGSSIAGCGYGAVEASSGATVWLTDGTSVTGAGVTAELGGSIVATSASISNAGNANSGVNVDGGSVLLNDTPVSGSGTGVAVHNGGYAEVIDGSVISGNGVGISADSGGHVQVGSDSDVGGSVKDNTGVGIRLVGGSTLQISQLATVSGNGGDGISLSDTSVGVFIDPVVTDNGGWGVQCDGSPSVAVIRGETSHVTGNGGGDVDCANAGQP